MKLKVTLNGTDENPWHKMGFVTNPFPQIARAELMSAMKQLNSLDGEPIKDTNNIRSRLLGWSEEFIKLCTKQFKLGERVSFTIEIPDC